MSESVQVKRVQEKREFTFFPNIWITYRMLHRAPPIMEDIIEFPICQAFTSQQKAIKHIHDCKSCNTFQKLDLK